MARRAAYIEKIRKENKNVLVIDSGDMFSQHKKPAELRAKTLAKAMGIMKYDAINLGDEELGFGLDFFNLIASDNKLNFVSSNIKINSERDQSIVKPYIIKNFKGFKVGITGVTPQSFFKLKEPEINTVSFSKDMNSDLDKTISELKSKTDFIILLSHLGFEASENYLKFNDVKGVSIAIAGHGRKVTEEPKKINDTYLVQNSMSGEHLGLMRIKIDDKGQPASLTLDDVILSLDKPENQAVAKLIKDFDLESAKIEEAERAKSETAEEKATLKGILKMKPEDFMEKMKGKNGQKVPLN